MRGPQRAVRAIASILLAAATAASSPHAQTTASALAGLRLAAKVIALHVRQGCAHDARRFEVGFLVFENLNLEAE